MMEITKRSVKGVFVKLLFHKQTDRGMSLLPFETRCVSKGEIHELVTTDHQNSSFYDPIDRVGFLGFVEILCGGIIEKGDKFLIGDQLIGLVLGFDGCHFPNHYNILISVDELLTASTANIKIEQSVCFLESVEQAKYNGKTD